MLIGLSKLLKRAHASKMPHFEPGWTLDMSPQGKPFFADGSQQLVGTLYVSAFSSSFFPFLGSCRVLFSPVQNV